MKSFFVAFIVLFFMTQPAAAARPVPLERLIVCPNVSGQTRPLFNEVTCSQKPLSEIDPQGHDLWVRGQVNVDSLLVDGLPLGLFVSGKASSEAYVNGVRLGANGTPAGSRHTEIPGRMDTVFYVPQGVLHAGANEVVLRLTAFHGTVHLTSPIQWVAVWHYSDPINLLLRAYWPSLITFGVLLAGGVFFACSVISRVNRRDPLFFSLLSFLAAGQLFAEVYRALAPYPFDLHDWRIIAVAGFSTAFGLVLTALVIAQFWQPRRLGVFLLVSVPILAPLVWVKGFDGKATSTILVAATLCALIAGRNAIKGDRVAILSCAALAAMALSVIAFPTSFLNVLFYFEVTAALLVLFIVHALSYEKQRIEYEQERLRAHDLELALARARPSENTRLRINAAGTVDLVSVADVAYCKGADDYVELHLLDRRVFLHNGSLVDLAKDLPPDFLRVHRSFIVNTRHVKRLTREGSGTGMLTLADGRDIPVSRRIMPSVRSIFL